MGFDTKVINLVCLLLSHETGQGNFLFFYLNCDEGIFLSPLFPRNRGDLHIDHLFIAPGTRRVHTKPYRAHECHIRSLRKMDFFGQRIFHRENRKIKSTVLSFFKKTKIYENVSQKSL